MDIMLTAGCARSTLCRRNAVGGDLLVWNGEEEVNDERLGFEALAFAALMVSFNAALLEAVASALALIDFAGEVSQVVCDRGRFWDPIGFGLLWDTGSVFFALLK
jgi:hypothetical protein